MEKWYRAYYKTRKYNRRSKPNIAYEIHFEANLLRLVDQINNQTYEPQTNAFFVSRPKMREVFSCEVSLNIVDARILLDLNPLIERRLTDRTFNNRNGYGSIKAINTLISDIYEVSEGFTKDAYIVKMDMSGYFPNAKHTVVYEKLREILDDEYEGEDKQELEHLLEIGIFSSATSRCNRLSPYCEWENYPKYKSLFCKPNGVGGVIGRGLWQVAMNVYLNDLDHKAIDTWGLKWCRFVDDIAIVTDNKEMLLQWIPVIRKELQSIGVSMHPKKFYCQHYTKGVEFIGAVIKMDRVYAKNKTIKNAVKSIMHYNQCVSVKYIQSFTSSVNSYIGILKGRNEHKKLNHVLSKICDEWKEYCYFDEKRGSLRVLKAYSARSILERKYNIKLDKYGTNRRNRKTGIRKIGYGKSDEKKRRAPHWLPKKKRSLFGEVPRRIR